MSEHKGSCSAADGEPSTRLSRLAARSVVLFCLLSSAGSAQQLCAANSSIDWVPFFIGQTYADILNRAPDRAGQLSNIAAVEDLNSTTCKSANAALSTGSCEWGNNAQAILDFLALPESVAKNGTLADNTAFVTALYELLLYRAPDSGLSRYVSQLNSGATRLSVVSTFLSRTDYRGRFTCTYGAVNPSCNGAESVDPV